MRPQMHFAGAGGIVCGSLGMLQHFRSFAAADRFVGGAPRSCRCQGRRNFQRSCPGGMEWHGGVSLDKHEQALAQVFANGRIVQNAGTRRRTELGNDAARMIRPQFVGIGSGTKCDRRLVDIEEVIAVADFEIEQRGRN